MIQFESNIVATFIYFVLSLVVVVVVVVVIEVVVVTIGNHSTLYFVLW